VLAVQQSSAPAVFRSSHGSSPSNTTSAWVAVPAMNATTQLPRRRKGRVRQSLAGDDGSGSGLEGLRSSRRQYLRSSRPFVALPLSFSVT